jgi:glucose-1-phosphate adenylyltransferase
MFDGYWEDIGTIGAFYRANLDLTSKIPKFNLFDAKRRCSRARATCRLRRSKRRRSTIRSSAMVASSTARRSQTLSWAAQQDFERRAD